MPAAAALVRATHQPNHLWPRLALDALAATSPCATARSRLLRRSGGSARHPRRPGPLV